MYTAEKDDEYWFIYDQDGDTVAHIKCNEHSIQALLSHLNR